MPRQVPFFVENYMISGYRLLGHNTINGLSCVSKATDSRGHGNRHLMVFIFIESMKA